MTAYTVALPAPVAYYLSDAIEAMSGQGYIEAFRPSQNQIDFVVEADSAYDLGLTLQDTFNDWEANGYYPYGTLDPYTLPITPDPREQKEEA